MSPISCRRIYEAQKWHQKNSKCFRRFRGDHGSYVHHLAGTPSGKAGTQDCQRDGVYLPIALNGEGKECEIWANKNAVKIATLCRRSTIYSNLRCTEQRKRNAFFRRIYDDHERCVHHLAATRSHTAVMQGWREARFFRYHRTTGNEKRGVFDGARRQHAAK